MKRRSGFSVIELIVVISIIGMLVGLFLPAVQQVRAAASRTACLSNLRQIGLALQNYESDRGSLPPVEWSFPPRAGLGYGAGVSWRVSLLPYLEQGPLWAKTVEASHLDRISNHNPPHVGMTTVVRTFVCPSDGRLSQSLFDPKSGITAAYGSYLGVNGSRPAFPVNPENRGVFASFWVGTRIAEILDGTSNTLAVGERPPPASLENGWWYSVACPLESDPGTCRGPAAGLTMEFSPGASYGGCSGPFFYGPGNLSNPCDRFHFWSLHSGGANFTFADGSARFISYRAKGIMAALATRAGGEVVSLPD